MLAHTELEFTAHHLIVVRRGFDILCMRSLVRLERCCTPCPLVAFLLKFIRGLFSNIMNQLLIFRASTGPHILWASSVPYLVYMYKNGN